MTVGKKQRAKVLNEGCANKSQLKVTSYIGIGEAFGVLRLWRSFGSLSRFYTDSGTSGSPTQFSMIVRVNTRLPKRRPQSPLLRKAPPNLRYLLAFSRFLFAHSSVYLSYNFSSKA